MVKQASLLAAQSRYVDGFEHLLSGGDIENARTVVTLSRRFGRWIILAFLVAIASLLTWRQLYHAVVDPIRFPINSVSIRGEYRHLQPSDIEVLVARELKRGFFGSDVGELRASLRQAPWVRDASIRRVWPDALLISVFEQVPVAAWGAGALLNEDGEVFRPDPGSLPVGLVKLSGPPGTARRVLERYRFLQQRLDRFDLKVESVILDSRRAWQIRLHAGPVIVVGRDHFEQRIDRLLLVADRHLNGGLGQFSRIDLRYTNGFAARKRRPLDLLGDFGGEEG